MMLFFMTNEETILCMFLMPGFLMTFLLICCLCFPAAPSIILIETGLLKSQKHRANRYETLSDLLH